MKPLDEILQVFTKCLYEKNEGLIYYRSGFGAKRDGIELPALLKIRRGDVDDQNMAESLV